MMTSKETICCFTGHRPEKLTTTEQQAKTLLKDAVSKAITNGYTTFITGMARGTDMWAAEIVLEFKQSNNNIKLICALPHPNFEKNWSEINRNKYNYILKYADEIHTISNYFSMGAYMKRNKWMVDNSSLLIAFYNGTSGGTRNTIDYARTNNLNIIML